MSKPYRLQIELPSSSAKRLATLKDETEAPSHAEVIRNALRLYEAVLREMALGREFMVREPGGVIVPFKMIVGA